jgi:hypothetical protein
MAPIPSREELEAMKRADLQKLCKVRQHIVDCRLWRIHLQDFGVKANLKTEALIDLLLNETKWDSYAIHNNHCSPLLPNDLVSDLRHLQLNDLSPGEYQAALARGQEEDPAAQSSFTELTMSMTPMARSNPNNPILSRSPRPDQSRIAKESQTRLGVGRPIIAGGSGARAVTKPPGLSSQKRGKSRGIKPTEATIQEGGSR